MSVLRSSIFVTLLSLIGSLLSFVNQLIIAAVYGVNAELDAYFIATSMPLFISGILNGTFIFLLLPVLVKFRINRQPDYSKFTGALLVCFFIMAIFVAAIMYIITPAIIEFIAPFLTPYVRNEAILMGRLAGVTCGVALLVGYLMILQNAVQKFVIPVIVNSLPYIGMICLTLLMSSFVGVKSLVWGMLLGYILAVPILYLGVRNDIEWHVNISAFKDKIKYVVVSLPLVLLSGLCFAIYGTVDAFWASRLGPSNVSYLNYGQKIIIAIGNLIILGPSMVLAPYFSTQVALGNVEIFKVKLEITIKMIFIFAVPLGLIASILSISMIEIVLQRGAFTLQETNGLAAILPGMLFGMIPMINVAVIYKALYAKNDLQGAALISILGSFYYFFMSGVFSSLWGIQGIIVTYITSWWLMLGLSVYRIWGTDLKALINLENKKFFFNLIIIFVTIGGVTLLGRILIIRSLNDIGMLNLIIRMSSIVFVDVVLFILFSIFILKIPEVIYFIRLLPESVALKIESRILKKNLSFRIK